MGSGGAGGGGGGVGIANLGSESRFEAGKSSVLAALEFLTVILSSNGAPVSFSDVFFVMLDEERVPGGLSFTLLEHKIFVGESAKFKF